MLGFVFKVLSAGFVCVCFSQDKTHRWWIKTIIHSGAAGFDTAVSFARCEGVEEDARGVEGVSDNAESFVEAILLICVRELWKGKSGCLRSLFNIHVCWFGMANFICYRWTRKNL